MAYLPIEHYGLIGDMYTAALVGRNGSIDWFCYPHFDSPSIFAAILDHRKGGRFLIAPIEEGVSHKQVYWPGTNILITRFLCPSGLGELVDYMPVGRAKEKQEHHDLVRRVSVARGSLRFRMECTPAFNYARDSHQTKISSDGACFYSPSLNLGLGTSAKLETNGSNGVSAEFTLSAGESLSFYLEQIEPGEQRPRAFSECESSEKFHATVEYWRRWLSRCTYKGRWRELVERSALALKLMTFQPTGAIVAAPTCSLPEALGGERNWDYRYTWIRDAAFTLYGLMRIGFFEEAAHFTDWLTARIHELEPDGSLQIMYGIDGRHSLKEETLDHLEGYRGSRPVRIGNGAHSQYQLDIYGEMMDSVYLYNKYGSPISFDLWRDLRRIINWVCDHWNDKDAGIWEVRGPRQHFVYSKVMCWVAVDRAVRLAQKRSFPADYDRWFNTRDQIYLDIIDKGWNPQRKAFVQHYGSNDLDAGNLIMPLVFFMSPSDPRMLSTLDETMKPPHEGGLASASLVYRYRHGAAQDGLAGVEGTFNMCSFWLVEALTRAGLHDPPRLDQARLTFEKMQGFASNLGLYAEETGSSGEALGNFPQAFTHLALISAAFNLDRVLGSR